MGHAGDFLSNEIGIGVEEIGIWGDEVWDVGWKGQQLCGQPQMAGLQMRYGDGLSVTHG